MLFHCEERRFILNKSEVKKKETWGVWVVESLNAKVTKSFVTLVYFVEKEERSTSRSLTAQPPRPEWTVPCG